MYYVTYLEFYVRRLPDLVNSMLFLVDLDRHMYLAVFVVHELITKGGRQAYSDSYRETPNVIGPQLAH